MQAVGYTRSLPITDPTVFQEFDLPKPDPGPRDLRVAVHAVSVNPVDAKVRANVAPEDGKPKLLGWDVSGVVDEVGDEVTRFKPGDEVYYAGSITRPGANSEFHLVDERIVGHKPKSLSFAEAAALPLTTLTAWELLFERLGVTEDTTGSLLIVGGAGGVGSILIQLAAKLTKLTVIATASRPASREWCESLGAHHVVDHSQPLDRAIVEAGLGPITHIAALTHSERHFPAYAEIIAPMGKIGIIDDPKNLDVMPLKRKSASLHWEFMFARAMFQTPDMAEQGAILDRAAQLVDDKTLRTTMRELIGVISPKYLRSAHERLESGETIGKLVLEGFMPPRNDPRPQA